MITKKKRGPMMFKNTKTFSSFAVNNSEKARKFYGETLDMEVNLVKGMEDHGVLELRLAGSNNILIYPKSDYEPATFTILNFPVSNIDKAVGELKKRGVEFERYDDEAYNMDKKSISRSKGAEPDIAWFKDPAGNILSVLEEK